LIQFRIALKYESEESSGYQLVSVMLKTPSSLKKKRKKNEKKLVSKCSRKCASEKYFR